LVALWITFCKKKESGSKTTFFYLKITKILRGCLSCGFIGFSNFKKKRVMKNSIIVAALFLSANAFGQSNDETQRQPIPVVSSAKVKIQTAETASPLIIVDGLALTATTAEERQKQLSELDPNSIDKIDVLKGKEQTAIYGEKGAKGVILITTKKAKSKE
jgi:TonB-dependent SusC/RagA subfamily outer membrane receptor